MEQRQPAEDDVVRTDLEDLGGDFDVIDQI
jgi:hypothetical protein